MADETRFDRWETLLLWLFPVTFLVHIAEEYWGGGGFSAYISRTRGVNLPPTRFLILNGLGCVLIVVGIILARRLRFSQWLLVCLGTIVLINGFSHTINSIVTAEYNPGVVSGLLIWIPFGAVVLFRLKKRMRARRYWTALAVGVAIHGVVTLLALTGGNPLRLLAR